MKKEGYYSSGQFAKMAHISVRTVRYYDKMNLLKPSFLTESGARFYTDHDLVRLQQIMLFKYLGFSLEDIKELTVDETDYEFMANSLDIQRKLVQDKIEQLQMVEQAIGDTTEQIRQKKNVDWSRMLDLIHMTGMENTLKFQYQNSTNISARIRLHHLYSANKQGWFPWIFSQCDLRSGMRILEVGCGNGRLWLENLANVPGDVSVVLSDISRGMVREIGRDPRFHNDDRFLCQAFAAEKIPFADESFDLVIANHMLFYCDEIPTVLAEIRRVLKTEGVFLCSTYGENHMKEITDLVQQFDSRIVLSGENLYQRFGRENGEDWLKNDFQQITWRSYEDSLVVDKPEPLVEYIISCHGNQNQYIMEKYHRFSSFVTEKVAKGFHISKDAGIFLAKNKKST